MNIKSIVAVVLLSAVFLVGVVIFSNNTDPTPIGYTAYRVHSGDTLWSIAEMSNGYGYIDIRIIIDQMDADPQIYPNDIVMIPQYEVSQ